MQIGGKEKMTRMSREIIHKIYFDLVLNAVKKSDEAAVKFLLSYIEEKKIVVDLDRRIRGDNDWDPEQTFH